MNGIATVQVCDARMPNSDSKAWPKILIELLHA